MVKFLFSNKTKFVGPLFSFAYIHYIYPLRIDLISLILLNKAKNSIEATNRIQLNIFYATLLGQQFLQGDVYGYKLGFIITIIKIVIFRIYSIYVYKKEKIYLT